MQTRTKDRPFSRQGEGASFKRSEGLRASAVTVEAMAWAVVVEAVVVEEMASAVAAQVVELD